MTTFVRVPEGTGRGAHWADQLTEEKHNPAKLANIDQLLTKFKGQETTLYRSTLVQPAPVLKGPEAMPSNIYQRRKSWKDMKDSKNNDEECRLRRRRIQ